MSPGSRFAQFFSIKRLLLILVLLPFSIHLSHAQKLAITMDDIRHPMFQAKHVSAVLDDALLEIRVGEIHAGDRSWRNVRIQCDDVRLSGTQIQCGHGNLQLDKNIPFQLSYDIASHDVGLTLEPAKNGTWKITRHGNVTRLKMVNGNLAWLASFFPAITYQLSAGRATGSVTLTTRRSSSVSMDMALSGLAFSDSSGLHAGDKLSGKLSVNMQQTTSGWNWQGDLDWQQGELFWQPVYVGNGGHRLQAKGIYSRDAFQVSSAKFDLDKIGSGTFDLKWNNRDKQIEQGSLQASNIALKGLYDVLLKPFLEKTAASEMKVNGQSNLQLQIDHGRLSKANIGIHNGGFVDENGRFGLKGVFANIPWSLSQTGQGEFSFTGGNLLKLPLGATNVQLATNGYNLTVAPFAVPIMDGKLRVSDFQAGKEGQGWHWQFSGGISPISVGKLATALGIRPLQGSLSGVIPQVSYNNSKLSVDGALLFRIFDGTAVVKNLAIQDAFGPAPYLTGDLDMRNLDLQLLTKAFSFGNMKGKIDVDVHKLVMSKWRPVSFQASVHSSPGDYPRRISQTAVQNISSLGGAGAAAAIQRSFLSFFKEFGYDQIGLSCTLRQGVCQMGGVEPAPQGYIIVKGGGIPAITVIGYNRSVDWDELLARLARITQSNTAPVIQ